MGLEMPQDSKSQSSLDDVDGCPQYSITQTESTGALKVAKLSATSPTNLPAPDLPARPPKISLCLLRLPPPYRSLSLEILMRVHLRARLSCEVRTLRARAYGTAPFWTPPFGVPPFETHPSRPHPSGPPLFVFGPHSVWTPPFGPVKKETVTG